MTIWTFCCSQKHRYTLAQFGHVEINLNLKKQHTPTHTRKRQEKSSTILKAHTHNHNFPPLILTLYIQNYENSKVP